MNAKRIPKFTKLVHYGQTTCDCDSCSRKNKKIRGGEEVFKFNRGPKAIYYCVDCAVAAVDEGKAAWKEFHTPENLFKKYGKKAVF